MGGFCCKIKFCKTLVFVCYSYPFSCVFYYKLIIKRFFRVLLDYPVEIKEDPLEGSDTDDSRYCNFFYLVIRHATKTVCYNSCASRLSLEYVLTERNGTAALFATRRSPTSTN